ncbi:MAG: DUF4128 domain-containing protein [Deltaproteobacteria bacterium]|nr:DUF4128 domain-containing protein [Deltaproteobacteria bacterium]
MSGVYGSLQAALDARLAAWASAATPTLEVAWENLAFTPPEDATWLRATFLPATPKQAGLGQEGWNVLKGVYQVSVFALSGEGPGPGREVADQLINHFPRGLQLEADGVTLEISRAWRAAPQDDEMWYHLPVSLEWFAYAENI